MIIDCIADLHGFYPKLEGGDLLIIAGDLTARDTKQEYLKFFFWIQDQKYKKIVFISGNHDNWMQHNQLQWQMKTIDIDIIYLCDSGTEFEGLKIWGSPWTKTFTGMNPKCKAFTVDTEEELAEKWALIPHDTDILITHSPPYGVLDDIKYTRKGEDIHQGSESLIKPLVHSKCRLHVFGHIHEAYGKFKNNINGITYVNASHVNERYQPVNKPIRVIL
jgi:Icc-related predicted phosphoesterase